MAKLTEAQAIKETLAENAAFDFDDKEAVAASRAQADAQFDEFVAEGRARAARDKETLEGTTISREERDKTLLASSNNPKSEKTSNLYKMEGALIDSDTTADDLFASYQKLHKSNDTKSAAKFAAVKRVQTENEEFKKIFNNLVSNSPDFNSDQIVDLVDATDQIIKENSTQVEGGDELIHNQYVQSLSNLPEGDERVARQENTQAMLADLQEHYDSLGITDLVYSVVDSFIGIKQLAESFQLTGGPFTSQETLKSFGRWFRGLPIEKQQAYWPEIKEHFFASKEKSKAIDLMRQLLDPSAEFSMEHPAFKLLETVELGAAVRGLVNLTKHLTVQGRLSAGAKNLDNIDVAANVEAASLVDETGQVATAINTDRVISSINGSPLNMSDVDPDTVRGLSPEIVERLLQFKAGLRESTEDIIEGKTALTPRFMTDSERVIQESKLVEEMKKAEEAADNLVLDTTIINRTTDGIEVEVLYDTTAHNMSDQIALLRSQGKTTNLSDLAPGQPLGVTKKLKFDFSNIAGKYEQDTLPFGDVVGSPRFWARDKKLVEDVQTANLLNGISPKIADELDFFERLAVKGLNRKDKSQVSDTLIKGDEWQEEGLEVGRLWTAKELRNGIPGVIKPHSDKQIESVLKLRVLYDDLGIITNAKARTELEIKGFKELRIAGIRTIGTLNDTKASALTFAKNNRSINTYVPETGRSVDLSERIVEEMYDKGFVLARTHKPFNPTPENTSARFRLAFVKSPEVRDLPPNVLFFKKAYVPRSYERGSYWGYKLVADTEKGLPSSRAVAHFDNKPDALAWEAQQNANAETLQSGEKFRQFPDKGIDQLDIWDQGLGFGTLYTSSRSSKPVPRFKTINGKLTQLDQVERKDALTALSNQINTISTHFPRNEWRLALEQRIKNTADHLDVKFEDMNTPIADTRKEGLFIEKLRIQYRDWMHFRTGKETAWETRMQDLYDWALDPSRPVGTDAVVGRGAWWVKSTNPVSAARGSTFHLLLGIFNPIQLWVQGQGASIAASMNILRPDKIAKLLSNQNSIRGIQKVLHNPEAAAEIAANVSRGSRYNAEGWVAIAKGYDRLGLKQGMFQTADYAAAEHGWATTRKGLKQAVEKGQLMYRAGEGFNRRFAYMTSLDEWIDAGLKQSAKDGHAIDASTQLRKLTDDELTKVGARANDLLLNLGRANRNLNWQTGPISITTQFWQVQAKMMESLFTKSNSFTAKERAKIALGQVGLYGAAAVPFSTIPALYMTEFLDISAEDIAANPGMTKAFNQGLEGWLASYVLGADVDVAQRGAILNNVERLMADLMFGTDKEWRELAGGAFGSVFGDSVAATKNLLRLSQATLGTKRYPTFKEYWSATTGVLNLTSTWKSGAKAYFMMTQDRIMNRRGVNVVEGKDFNWQTELAVGLGFQPAEASRVHSASMINRWREDYESTVKTEVKKLMIDWTGMAEDIEGTFSEKDRVALLSNIDVLTGSLSEEAYDRIMKSVSTELLSGKSKQDKVFKKFFERQVESSTTSLQEKMVRAITTTDDITDFIQDVR